MKKSPTKQVQSHNILDMFKKQSEENAVCPTCGLTVSRAKLNAHLEADCSSSSNATTKSPEVRKSKLSRRNLKKSIENGVKHDVPLNRPNIKKTESNKKEVQKVVAERSMASTEARKGNEPSNINSVSAADGKNADKVLTLKSTLTNYRSTPSLPRFKRTYSKIATPDNVNDSEHVVTEDSSVSQTDSTFNTNQSPKLKHLNSNTQSEDSVSSAEASKDDDEYEKSKDAVAYSPYYIANFKYIVDNVLNDEYNKHLFDKTDLKFVETFHSVSDKAQKLYVRLFQRKYKWLRPNNMHYADLADGILEILEELTQYNLLDSGADDVELETALNLLSLAEVKSLSKHFNFNASGKNKTEIIELLIKHGKQHKSLFFSGSNSVASAMLKKVKQILGPCYRLALEPKRLFTRILMLFSLPTISEDDEEAAGGQQQQLLTLLQVNKGELVFPSYKLSREFQIFENRDALIKYEFARQNENNILNAIESKKFDVAKNCYLAAKDEYHNLCRNNSLERDKSMPFFLRRYSASHVYTRCLTQGVEILQKLREYEKAVAQLEELLGQSVYCQDRRGQWWERLALNLDQHLKLRDKAAECIKTAAQDPYVRVGPRHSLLLRAERLKKNKDCDKKLKECVLELTDVIKAPSVIISGRLLPHPIPGRKHIFISSKSIETSSENDVTVLPVEQVALEHYRDEGYTEGVHGEGSTFVSLYALLFWDIVYDGSIPDAFISPYQTHPLDINSDDFFLRRETQITRHLKHIKEASNEELCKIVRTTWDTHYNQASLVNWDLFTDCKHVEGLVSCFGNVILASICERLSKDFRFTRSGVPDLVVWNPETNLVKVAEVKGPGDKLSSKQIMWLDYLIRIGADAEVCLVEAVGSKRLRRQ